MIVCRPDKSGNYDSTRHTFVGGVCKWCGTAGVSPDPLLALRTWLSASPGRECQIVFRGINSAWWVELFDSHTCLASIGMPDMTRALTRALEVATESERRAS